MNLISKFLWFCRAQAVMGAGYFQILITLDRTLNILYYKRFKFLTKINNLVLLTVLMEIIVAVGINSIQFGRYHTYKVSVDQQNMTQYQVTSCAISNDLQIVGSFGSIFGRLIPSIANMIMNGLIIHALVRSKRNVSNNHRISVKEYSFAFSLIAQNFIFFLLTLPQIILNILQIYSTFTNPSSVYNSIITVVWSIVSVGIFIFESMHFFMQLAFNRIFRAEFKEIVFCR